MDPLLGASSSLPGPLRSCVSASAHCGRGCELPGAGAGGVSPLGRSCRVLSEVAAGAASRVCSSDYQLGAAWESMCSKYSTTDVLAASCGLRVQGSADLTTVCGWGMVV